MKSKFYLILAACCAFLAVSPDCVAENYFREGMKWEYEITPVVSPRPTGERPVPYPVTLYIEGKDFKAGKECMKLYSIEADGKGNHPIILTYIHTEGDKVYFLPMNFAGEPESDEWLLLFNFGLKAGETDRVTLMFWSYSQGGKEPVTISCSEVMQQQTPFGVVNRMKMSHGTREDGEWIDGIGCVRGCAVNGGWDLDGAEAGTLLRASLNGEVLYENVNAGVEAAVADAVTADVAADCYKPDGTPFLPGDKGLCISNGKKRIVR